jgi:hypothetical protein
MCRTTSMSSKTESGKVQRHALRQRRRAELAAQAP